MIKIFTALILIHISSLCASCAQTVGDKPQTVEDIFLSFPQSLSGNPVFLCFSWIPAFAGMTECGRIAFGPDGMLYITAGETFNSELAQNLQSLGGKILRITPGGQIPDDNPFKGSPVYSYGHRNPQGICWQPGTNKLFESEHRPSGEFGHFAHDEINIITKGGNYGWPEVIGTPGLKPYIDPI